ncbi:helix-turn-helix domain-containing protein [Desulfobacter sp.]|uniref:helix-turn-helix domain-containing protein n=1 Tax=Desulfobacter sp. TaxID=2294 RepID=UPI003D0EBB4D
MYRENAGLTQEALGKILGDLPKQHISNMKNNHRKITLEMAKKLAPVFNTSPVRFLDL